MGHVFGARVVRAEYPVHGKTSPVSHFGNYIFANLPSPVNGTRYHSLIIERSSLPDCFDIIADTADGTIMGIQHKTYPLTGLQFHPESILTPDGPSMLSNWLTMVKKYKN